MANSNQNILDFISRIQVSIINIENDVYENKPQKARKKAINLKADIDLLINQL